MTLPSSNLAVTLVQASLLWHDVAGNHGAIRALLDDAPATDLIVLPEMFASGFSMTPAQVAQTMDGPSVTWMRALAVERSAAVGGSLVIERDGQFVNRFVLVTPDGDTQHYDKRHRFALAGEDKHYAAGDRRLRVEYRGWRIVPFICYDLRFPVWCRYATGCDLMLFVANWPNPRRSAWNTLLRARAIENQCFVAGVNRTGCDDNEKSYFGDSVLLDGLGETIVACGDQPMTVTATLDATRLRRLRDKLPFHRDADAFDIATP
ncbi:MAG: amidohydrolase [Gammaproteobacteria bacterium]